MPRIRGDGVEAISAALAVTRGNNARRDRRVTGRQAAQPRVRVGSGLKGNSYEICWNSHAQLVRAGKRALVQPARRIHGHLRASGRSE